MSIRKTDILDGEIIDAYELSSDGYLSYLTTSLVSSDNSTKQIIIDLPFDGNGILYSKDHPVQSDDIIYLSGTSDADGYYTVDTVLTDLIFTVNENISSSIGGNIVFIYPSGATNVGFNSRGLLSTTASTLQDAVKDVATVVDNFTNNSVSPDQHQTLRQLIHFLDSGPGNGFSSTAYKKTLPDGSIFPTSIIWYLDNLLSIKLIEQLVAWNGIVPHTIVWNMYDTDGLTIIHTIKDTFSYTNNVFEALIKRDFIL